MSSGDETKAFDFVTACGDDWLDFEAFGRFFRVNVDYDVTLNVAIYEDFLCEEGHYSTDTENWANPLFIITLDSENFSKLIEWEILNKSIELTNIND